MTQEDLTMLDFWLDDKGIEECFKRYYPKLAESDKTLAFNLRLRESAETAILLRVQQLTKEASEAEEEADD